ncbi:hypothetical protein PHYPSEUDO_003897, partial [Phytophthora pseudosyringae]
RAGAGLLITEAVAISVQGFGAPCIHGGPPGLVETRGESRPRQRSQDLPADLAHRSPGPPKLQRRRRGPFRCRTGVWPHSRRERPTGSVRTLPRAQDGRNSGGHRRLLQVCASCQGGGFRWHRHPRSQRVSPGHVPAPTSGRTSTGAQL